jgi:hypothetical protein
MLKLKNFDVQKRTCLMSVTWICEPKENSFGTNLLIVLKVKKEWIYRTQLPP